MLFEVNKWRAPSMESVSLVSGLIQCGGSNSSSTTVLPAYLPDFGHDKNTCVKFKCLHLASPPELLLSECACVGSPKERQLLEVCNQQAREMKLQTIFNRVQVRR